MSKEFISGFIEIYEKNECLWKLTSPEYTNKNLKNIAYKELVLFSKKYFGEADTDFVKKKIQNLKTAFRKELKKVYNSKESGNSADDVYIPKLWYFDLLLFTTDDVLPKPSIDSRKDGTNDVYEGEDSTEEIFDVEDDDSHQSKKSRNEEKTEEETSESSDVSQPRILQKSMNFKLPGTSKSKQQSTRNQSNKYLGKKEVDFLATCTEAITQINKTSDVDEFGAVALTWASKLRKLKEEQMVLAEGLINEVLMRGYFNELTRTTTIKDDMPNNTFPTTHSWPLASSQSCSPSSNELASPRSTESISPRSTELLSDLLKM